MKVTTLVFDLDGTISDPSSGIVNCVNHALSRCGYNTRTKQEISAEIGPPLDLMFRKFIPQITNTQIDDLVVAYRERFVTDGYKENFLYDGIVDAINALSERGFTVGVCTSKPERSARTVLEHFGLLHHFKFVSGGDIGIAKQSQLKDLLDADTIDNEAVMIGDRGVDLSAARNNGLRAVGVLWGFGNIEELNAEKPEFVLSRVDELVSSFTIKNDD